MISLREPAEVSANNVIAVCVSNLDPVADGLVDVMLAAGGTTLIARITRASASRLRLVAGTNVFAVIKAVTVDAAMKIGPDPAPFMPLSRD
jgi:molybdate transport system ATP-binding protein